MHILTGVAGTQELTNLDDTQCITDKHVRESNGMVYRLAHLASFSSPSHSIAGRRCSMPSIEN